MKSIVILMMIIVLLLIIAEISYLPGVIYFTQSDQKLETVLKHSNIKERLTEYYKFDITKDALNSMVIANRYSSFSSFKFDKDCTKNMYISILEEILSRNNFRYSINEDTKVICIKR